MIDRGIPRNALAGRNRTLTCICTTSLRFGFSFPSFPLHASCVNDGCPPPPPPSSLPLFFPSLRRKGSIKDVCVCSLSHLCHGSLDFMFGDDEVFGIADGRYPAYGIKACQDYRLDKSPVSITNQSNSLLYHKLPQVTRVISFFLRVKGELYQLSIMSSHLSMNFNDN